MEKKKIKKYRIKVNEKSEMKLISIVDHPAIEVKGLLFNNSGIKEIEIKLSKEKKEIFAPFLIPNFEIPRKEDGELYAVYFDKEGIEKLVEKYQSLDSNRKINFNHKNKMVDGFIKELWIKESEYDKSMAYEEFKNLPIGTAFMIVKIEDDNFWNNEVKKLGFDSFSIEYFGEIEEEGEIEIEYDFSEIIEKLSEEEIFEILQEFVSVGKKNK
jgi:hypothetical protein